MSAKTSQTPTSPYPEGASLDRFVRLRNSVGNFWWLIFLFSVIIGIIALMALLYNIINSAFGLTMIENQADPQALVLAVQEEKMLNAPNVVSSEDDNDLVQGISGNPNAIGFFGYAYYQANQDKLQALSVDGVGPAAQTAESGEYPLARPLFIYSAVQVMEKKPQVAAFIDYYLTHVNEEIADVGYFPASEETLISATVNWLKANKLEAGAALPPVDPATVTGDIVAVGSSTVFPLTDRLAQRFEADGYADSIKVDNIGTTAGFRSFCVEGKSDLASASRAITSAERSACLAKKREPVEFRVGTDALVVVVSRENTFLKNVTTAELQQIFTTAEKWSDVNPSWPNAPIERFIPGADSGTLDFFTETIFSGVKLADLSQEELVTILQTAKEPQGKKLLVSKGKLRQLESEQLFYEDKFLTLDPERHAQECAAAQPPSRCTTPPRDQENVYNLVEELVVAPNVVATWSLRDSLLKRSEIEAEAVEKYPGAVLEFRSWLSGDFVREPQSSQPELAGVRTAILGSLWVIGITILVAFPIGVGAAIYLEEYASMIANPFLRRLNGIIQTNINNLGGVPSIIYGMLGLAIFVRALEPLTSGAAFGAVTDPATANGRTIISAGLTMALLILPVIIINAQEAIRAVPLSLRQAGMALGATKWQTIWSHVLPNAIPGILTGSILAISRALGETAPLVVIGASTFITIDPNNPFDKFTTLPIQIYQWTARPQAEFRNIAAAAIIVLLILLLTLNISAVLLRNRYSRRFS
jgi:phosphate transport system permease protein